jgi:hypothetical protein
MAYLNLLPLWAWTHQWRLSNTIHSLCLPCLDLDISTLYHANWSLSAAIAELVALCSGGRVMVGQMWLVG